MMSKTDIVSRVRKTVERTIEKHSMLNNVRHLVVGFSGGPDSMCLLDILIDISKEQGFFIHPVHIDHGIRKGVSQEEAEFCKDFCESRNLAIVIQSHDCEAKAKEWGMSTEAAGRRIRYDAFWEVSKEYGDCPVAVAQNSEDQAETILMRIVRGTGIDGLAGIPYVRNDERGYEILRPLLDVSREDIESYCAQRGLAPRIDATNSQAIYQRNKMRLDLIPYIEEKYNAGFSQALRRLGESAREDRTFLESLAGKGLEEALISSTCDEVKLHGDIFRKFDPAVRRRVLALALKSIGLSEDMGYEHYTNADELIFGGNPSAEMDLPGGFFIRNVYENLLLGKSKGCDSHSEMSGDSYQDNMPMQVEVSVISPKEAEGFKGQKSVALFDKNKIIEKFGENALSLIVARRREAGDVMVLKVGTKKLQDIMVDSKIPKSERDEARVVAIGREVLWLCPVGNQPIRWTSEYGVDENSIEVLLLK